MSSKNFDLNNNLENNDEPSKKKHKLSQIEKSILKLNYLISFFIVICVGGESDEWIDDALKQSTNKNLFKIYIKTWNDGQNCWDII